MYNDSVGEEGMLEVKISTNEEGEAITEGIDFDAIFAKFVGLND